MTPTPGPSYRLKAFTPQELDAFNADFRALIDKHGVEVRTAPMFILEQTTGKYLVDAQVVVYKKELAPNPKANEGATEPTTQEPAPVLKAAEASSEVPAQEQANS